MLGVETERSAANAARGTSLWWPIAAITGTGKPVISLTSNSLLNASIDSKEPPPRIITNTSIFSFFSVLIESNKSAIAACPSTRESIILILNPNLPKLFKKSARTAPCFEVIIPTFCGYFGITRFLTSSKSPSLVNFSFNFSYSFFRAPSPAYSITSDIKDILPESGYTSGYPVAIILSPSFSSMP